MKVEIWSDIVCPWCYIGKRNFEQALELFAHRSEVEVTHRSFMLDPTAPQKSSDSMIDHLSRKFNQSPDDILKMMAKVMSAGAQSGLQLKLDETKAINSLNAHCISHLAATQGLQSEAVEALMNAHFTATKDLSDTDVLVEIATSIGLDGDVARKAIESGTYVGDVELEHETARDLGVTAVPFFVIDQKLGISGAQKPDVILDALQDAWSDGAKNND